MAKTERLWLPAVAAAAVAVAVAAAQIAGADVAASPQLAMWGTVTTALVVQALPFLVAGVALSGAVAAFVDGDRLARLLPDRPVSVVKAAASGMVVPGCECGTVPLAARLVRQGAAPAAALAFMVAAPAVNPVVMAATAVAFPGQPRMVVARLVASLIAAVVVGLVWARMVDRGRLRALLVRRHHSDPGRTRLQRFVGAVSHDTLRAGGWLVVGASASGLLQVAVPRTVLTAVASHLLVAVVIAAVLAIVLSICSEADAFVAASLVGFSPVVQLTFMVVGPFVDLKLVAMHAGVFGRRFATTFAPLAVAVTVASAVGVGTVLL